MKSYVQADKNIQLLLSNNQKYHIASQSFFKSKNISANVDLQPNSNISVPNSIQKKSISTLSVNSSNQPQQSVIIQSPKSYNSKIKLRENHQPYSARSQPNKINYSNQSLTNFNQILHFTVKSLDLSNNSLTAFPTQLPSNITELYISQNLIKKLPNTLYTLQHLTLLNINQNHINELPKLPPKLTYLYIAHNLLHVFPTEISHSSLKILHLQGNPIYLLQSLPSTLEELGLDWFKYVKSKEIIQGPQITKLMEWLKTDEEKIFHNFAYYFQPQFKYEKIDTFGRSILHRAAIAQDLGVIIGCHKRTNPNRLDYTQMTPLFLSIKEEAFHSAKYLLTIGADPNIKCGPYGSILSLCLVKNQFYLIQLLLQRGADPNIVDKDGNSSLHYLMALWKDTDEYRNIALALLQKGACSNIRNSSGYAPLHMCIRRGNTGACQFAIDYIPPQITGQVELMPRCTHSFNLDIKAGNRTALSLAALYNQPKIAQILLNENVEMENVRASSSGNVVAKMIKKKQYEIINQQLFGQKNQQKKKHYGYEGYCINLRDKDRINKIGEDEVKVHNNYLGRSMSYEKRDIRSKKFLVIKGDTSDVDFSNDSKSEMISPKMSINQSKLQRNVVNYNGLRSPKLDNGHKQLLRNLEYKWQNMINYFESSGNKYCQEFKQSESCIVQMKLLTLLIKMHIQVIAAHEMIMRQKRLVSKNKIEQSEKRNIILRCIRFGLEQLMSDYVDSCSQQSMIQEEVHCQFVKKIEDDQSNNNLSIISSQSGTYAEQFMNKQYYSGSYQEQKRVYMIEIMSYFLFTNGGRCNNNHTNQLLFEYEYYNGSKFC